jgi:hypothetical protein
MGGNVRLGAGGDGPFDDIKRKYPDVKISIGGNAENGFNLSKIVVPKGSRGGGVGNSVMSDITERADSLGARVTLSPSGDFGGNKARLGKFYKALGFVDNKGKNKDFATMETMYRDPKKPTLPTPRTDAEAMAKQVLEMRAAGNAGDVTDDMMAMADDPYMFNNTPLDMSAEGRKGRAGDAGFDTETPMYHGTGAQIDAVDPSRARMDSDGTGFYTSDDPYTASSYAELEGVPRGKVYPLAVRSEVPHVYADFDGYNWDEFSANSDPSVFHSSKNNSYDPFGWGGRDPEDLAFERFRTDDIARSAKMDGHDAAIFDNVMDHVSLDDLGPSMVRVDFDPANIRSQYARFDPAFKHLRNLSAGVGGVGLLSQADQRQQRRGLLE